MNATMIKMLAATGLSAFLIVGCGEDEKTPVKAEDAMTSTQEPSASKVMTAEPVVEEKSAVDKMKEGAAMTLEGAKEKVSEVSGDVSEKAGEMVDKAKEVTSESIEVVKDVTADTIESAKEVTAKGADKVKEAME